MVDGLNGTDKNCLARCMCLMGIPDEANSSAAMMKSESVSENGMVSPAEECARLCGLDSRIGGVKGGKKACKTGIERQDEKTALSCTEG